MLKFEWKFEKAEDGRCINLDWLEVYCTESCESYPYDANYYTSKGYLVRERDYGTRQYKQMFTVLDAEGFAFCEIRRAPVSSDAAQCKVGMYDPYSCHIKLANRYCYHPQAVRIFSDFLNEHKYSVNRIFRLDIALDFTKFDYGDDPNEVMKRYVSGRYTKINQGTLTAHAQDTWESRNWNSLSWGSEKSMVSTKFYEKSLELKQSKDKPYIRYAWQCAGLVDDYNDLCKIVDGEKTYPKIYRVEFSIRSSARGWFVVEDCNGNKQKKLVRGHTLADYETRQQLVESFASLSYYSFHFKKYEAGIRKDRCQDKVLFDFGLNHKPYRIDHLMNDTPKSTPLERLRKQLELYRLLHLTAENREAINLLLHDINRLMVSQSMSDPYDKRESLILQQLIALRMSKLSNRPLEKDVQLIQQLLNIQDDLF